MRSLLGLLVGMSLVLAARAGTVAVYDLEGIVPESGFANTSIFAASLQPEKPLTFFDVSKAVHRAAEDPEVEAIVMEIDGAMLNLAQLQELRAHLLAARESGKDVWFYSDYYTNETALLGSAANHFVLMPEAGVVFAGIASESLYFKGLLDKIGVEADVIHIGDFKSFGEEFYRTGPSEFAEKQQEKLVSGHFDQLVQDVAEGRDLERAKVVEMINRGTFTAEEAKAAGLVDELNYRTGFNKTLRETYADASIDHEYALPDRDGPQIDGVMDLFKMVMGSNQEKAQEQDYVAVVSLEGAISDASVAPVRQEIARLIDDERARALVLRVDSPGGSALASEVLWEMTDQWKATGRSFAVSMGGVAASGGYYVSAGADQIFAQPGTITGSIGVVGMKLVVSEALNQLGITTHKVKRGEHADAMLPTEPFSEEETKLVREAMRDVYETFKMRVGEGRGERLQGDLESLAGGRVYTGTQAAEIGLVDKLGGLADAIEWAAGEANLEKPEARLCPEPKTFVEQLLSRPEERAADEIVRMSANSGATREALRELVRDAGMSALPAPVRRATARAIERLEAVEESAIQLIGPDYRVLE